ncbi:PREDICTED: rho GDP-dissociation inhibitor 1-like [Nelumbo nucifera]|uniref:Rho GDP-dissociation inhibitor 1-like n=1 Tax=Nelumbo nucifera TaxID=4432 RepID=A0A1U8A1J5_NELNU|nr:PREDICTED: rho GDP-dissociation inhibitor 1-like [Nelumbo nucifera]
MSAVVGVLSSPQGIPFNPSQMEKEEEKSTTSNNDEQQEEPPENTEAEKHNRKFSCSSVYSTENEDDFDDDGDDDDDDCKLKPDKELCLGPQFSLKEQLEKDKDDESLRRWKEQLLGSVDLSAVGEIENTEPEVKIQSLTIRSPDRPEVVLPIPFTPNAKGHAFVLKDGSRYSLKFSFTVSNNIVSGLRYRNTVWKSGLRVVNTRIMLGTYSPQNEPYTLELEEETTPSGMFARGTYSARTKFMDDDGKCHLDITYNFEIRKDWPSPS